jgi:hypothetical protein
VWGSLCNALKGELRTVKEKVSSATLRVIAWAAELRRFGLAGVMALTGRLKK